MSNQNTKTNFPLKMNSLKYSCKSLCITLLLLIAIAHISPAQEKTITCYSYYIDSLNRKSDTDIVQIETYNKKQQLAKKIVINANDTVPIYFVEYYDKKGKRTRKDIYTQDSSFVQVTLFQRDKHGEITVQKSTQKKEQYNLIHTNHYIKGKISNALIEMKIGDSIVKEMSSEIIYRYDEKGNQIALTNFLNGSFLSETLKKYDAANNLIEENIHDRMHAEKSKSITTYNNQKQKIAQSYFENGTLVSTLKFFWQKDFNSKIEINYPKQNIKEIRYFLQTSK